MADNIKRDEVTGDVVEVNFDEVIKEGDPRWGVHNPERGERDTLAVHDEEVDTSAIQEDIPQKEAHPSEALYIVDPEDQASVKEKEAASKSSSTSSKKS